MNDNAQVIELVTQTKESLEREISGLGQQMERMEQRLNGRFDVLESRIELHAGLLRSGQTNRVRLNKWH